MKKKDKEKLLVDKETIVVKDDNTIVDIEEGWF